MSRKELKRLKKQSKNIDASQCETKDTSLYVYQNKRLDFDLEIRPFPWTEKQKVFIEAGLDKYTNYILCEAPVGVGKTLLAVYIGLKLLQEKRISNLYFVRLPQESASKGIGYTPGTAEEKMAAFQMPMIDQLNQLLPPSQISKLFKDGFIQTVPLGFVKGRTFNSSLVIVDEAEDLTKQEMLLIMGRLGRFSRMLLIGDSAQTNIRNSGFRDVYNLFDDLESKEKGVFSLSFDESDIKRNAILSYIVSRFKQI